MMCLYMDCRGALQACWLQATARNDGAAALLPHVVEVCRYSDVAPAGGDDVDVVDLILAIRALRIGADYM